MTRRTAFVASTAGQDRSKNAAVDNYGNGKGLVTARLAF
jgi:hypothetical protein